MEYDKNTWQSGDTITAAKLNNIENALAALAAAQAPLEVNGTLSVDPETGKQRITLDKKAAEVFDSVAMGKTILLRITVILPQQDGEDIEVHAMKALKVDMQKNEVAGLVAYDASYITCDEDGVTSFYATELAADDPVILTEV